MRKKPTMQDLARPELSEDAKNAVLVAFDDARKEQQRLLKKAKMLAK